MRSRIYRAFCYAEMHLLSFLFVSVFAIVHPQVVCAPVTPRIFRDRPKAASPTGSLRP